MVGLNTLILSQSGGNDGIGFAAPEQHRALGATSRSGEQRTGAPRRHRRARPDHHPRARRRARPGLRPRRRALGRAAPAGRRRRRGCEWATSCSSLDGKPMENARQLDVNLYRRAPGDSVTLDVVRDGVRTRSSRGGGRGAAGGPGSLPRAGDAGAEPDPAPRGAGARARRRPPAGRRARCGRRRAFWWPRAPGRPRAPRTTCGPATSSTPSTACRCGASPSCARRSAGPRPGQPLVLHVERAGQLLYVVVEIE